LSSRATIILVKFSRPELKTILGGEKYKIKSTKDFKEIMEDKREGS
jgi:hypothetical protein